jgi:sugar phosphate isomerase/epimerase
LNRKDFIRFASVTASTILAPAIEGFASSPNFHEPPNNNFQLKMLATNWGFKGTVDQFCAAARAAGYDAVEIWWPGDEKGRKEMFEAVKKHSLELGIILGGWQTDWKEHFETFKTVTTEAANNKLLKPLYINCHSGRDHFSMEKNIPFIEHTLQLSKDTGILICHETHRGRIMFAAHVTRDYIAKYPDLKLTFDVSHWCNVHESLLDDQEDAVGMAIARTEHIHARVGHAEGPQVNDPRAPEWKAAFDRHLQWWDKIAARKRKNGELLTILTEFGPADYMPALPYTRQPLADQWEINVFMMKMLRERYRA